MQYTALHDTNQCCCFFACRSSDCPLSIFLGELLDADVRTHCGLHPRTQVPELIQSQLSEAIAEIGKSDFTSGEWPELLPHMITQFGTQDFHVINGVLKTACPLFERYRHAEKTDNLWSEIKCVLCPPPLPTLTLDRHVRVLVRSTELCCAAIVRTRSS